MYLTDLSFIEEGALNITENNLVNFCKMRMVCNETMIFSKTTLFNLIICNK